MVLVVKTEKFKEFWKQYKQLTTGEGADGRMRQVDFMVGADTIDPSMRSSGLGGGGDSDEMIKTILKNKGLKK